MKTSTAGLKKSIGTLAAIACFASAPNIANCFPISWQVANDNRRLTLPSVHSANSLASWQSFPADKIEFDVASVKQDNTPPGPGADHSNMPLDSQDGFNPTGGLFIATGYRLITYIAFAYKFTNSQLQELSSHVPKWVVSDRFAIEARASGNPTKDDYRAMMRSLLADRFNMVVHYENRSVPVLALTLIKPGHLGPNLVQHSDSEPCSTARPLRGPIPTVARGFPISCGAFYQLVPAKANHFAGGARNVSMSVIAETLTQGWSGIHEPVVDRTGLKGNYDFLIDFSLLDAERMPLDPDAGSFLEALREELGLKLEETSASMPFIVIDQIQALSAN
jgi:uncharacterized protein (TIGR03435 family)